MAGIVAEGQYRSSTGLTYYDGFYDLFDINEDEKKIAYKITTDGVKHRI